MKTAHLSKLRLRRRHSAVTRRADSLNKEMRCALSWDLLIQEFDPSVDTGCELECVCCEGRKRQPGARGYSTARDLVESAEGDDEEGEVDGGEVGQEEEVISATEAKVSSSAPAKGEEDEEEDEDEELGKNDDT